ncbi:TPA: hypothetical protein U1C94_000979 [Streptococcus suis]|uniref:hypothetical protein n=1 Tax=Streptococcus ruminantium TaxID=1917441 RepID=UPI0012DDCF02|nr:hypothetical protein [Streptococcus ruminantium]HEM3704678.1 hypothetical protein [Streptococcus suis]
MMSIQPRLNAFEKLAEVFRKTYLELEVGETVEIGRLSPLKVDYQALIEKGIFTASYQIGENKTLNYTFKCQDFEAIQSIYGPKGDCDLHKFFKQEVIVLMSEVI